MANPNRSQRHDHEEFVPDPQVWREFGVTRQTLNRWDQDNKLNFPPRVKIGAHNYRSRRQLEEFKAALLRAAIAQADRWPLPARKRGRGP